MEKELEDVKDKNKGLRSRMAILDKTNREKAVNFHSERQTLIEKSESDDRYIELLKRELDKLKNNQQNNI